MKGFRLFPSLLVAFVLTLLSTGQAQAEVTYYINDHLGSPIAAEDENGVLLWRERYSPFGDAQLGQKRDEETPGYTGKHYYGDLGLSYFGARWYDSTSGRFITPDPAGWQESSPYFSFNQYAYANNNPYVYTDPDGEFPFLIPVAIFLAKEIAGEIFERTTGVPAVFSVKGAGKAIFKQGRKLITKSQPKTRVFWSGRGARESAEKFAQENNAITLGDTVFGKALDKITTEKSAKYLDGAWVRASSRFASKAKDEVHVFHSNKGVGLKSAWRKTEYPILRQNKIKIKYHNVE